MTRAMIEGLKARAVQLQAINPYAAGSADYDQWKDGFNRMGDYIWELVRNADTMHEQIEQVRRQRGW